MGITSVISQVLQCFVIKDVKPSNYISDEELLQDAHQELAQARNIFSRTNPENIDYAVYNLLAAEERYNSLIKQFKKQENISPTRQYDT